MITTFSRFGMVLALSLAASAAMAQDSEAREAFNQGLEAARSDDWEAARAFFERAYELAPRASVLVNLAGAQRQTGQLVEAKASYERWLEDPDPRLRGRVQDELDQLLPLIPTLTVSVPDSRTNDQLMIDGSVVEQNEATPVNPGWREIELVRNGRTISSMRVNISERDRDEVQLTIRAIPTAQQTAERGDPVEDGDGEILIHRNPDEEEASGSKTWLWVTLAIVGVAVAGGITAAIVVSGGEDPFIGNAPPGMAVLR